MAEEREYYVPLYRLAISHIPEDYRLQQITEWLSRNALKLSSQIVRRTFKRANRPDLSEIFLTQEDIFVGDTVRSKSTGRFGKVIGELWDGESVVVKWETGGSQKLPKGNLLKIHNQKETELTRKDFSVGQVEYDTYKTMLEGKDKVFKNE